ncbi:DNRLRE domain-containing protein [Kitasatospora purpeofusca]|uniref:DNRLRE domain-containing protein n=1 Tax=Kitasatospora purpeofusca TaxID=67352 RepID=UPI003F61C926
MHVSRRTLSGPPAAALALTLVLGAGAPVAFAAKPPAKPAPGKPPTAAPLDPGLSIGTARAAAQKTGKRVEAVSERDETSTTWANPDGTLTTELSAGPVRFLRDGKWADVDLTLKTAADGSVAPAAHPNGLKLAGAGGKRPRSLAESKALQAAPAGTEAAGTDAARTLVSLGSGDDQLALEWRGGLPKPELNGTRATYRDAIGDGAGDLVVEATRTGFEQFVLLKQRPATGGYTYTMPLRAKGTKAEAQPDGSVLFTDRKNGQKRAVLPAPVMWDATTTPGSSEHPRQARVGLEVVQRGDTVDLVFTPDAAFLADPATVYPVTVDPATAGLGNAFDTRVQKGETVDWSADTEIYWGNSGTKNADGSSREARSFINWNTAGIADALVSSATLSLYNFHSGNSDCQPYTWEVWDTGLASTASRWTAQPAWKAKKGSSTETKGRDACGGDGWINANVTDLVQTWASAKNSTSGMGLRAPDEVSTKYWKEVNSANAATNVPKLTVNYNYRPRTGTKQQAGPPFLQDGTGTWRVDTATPVLRDTFVDPDGDKVTGTFQLVDAISGAQVGAVNVSGYVPSGTPSEVTVPAGLLEYGHTYRFRSSPYDGLHYNLSWSPWVTFSVSPLPDVPTALQTGADQTLTPVLSALATNPNQGRIRTEFSLKNSAGVPLPTVLPAASAESGVRASVQVPEGALTDGGTYRWAARACTNVGCSAWTADQSLTVHVQTPPVTPVPVTLTMDGAALASASVATGGNGCTAGACPAADPAVLKVGAVDGTDWAAWLKPDLTALPKGARITGARLALTRSDCATGCAAAPADVYQLSGAWNPGGTGAELVANQGSETYAAATAPADLDLTPMLQSWADRGQLFGLALRPTAGAPGVAYHSGAAANPAARPRLTVDYLAPTVPAVPQQVGVNNGDAGLVGSWSAPLDHGASEDVFYTVKVEAQDNGAVVQQFTTAETRAVVTGLDNTRGYRLVLTANNSFGAGPVVVSAYTQGKAAAGGSDLYRGLVQEYLDARSKVRTTAGLTVPEAAVVAAHGTAFVDLLATQEDAVVGSREGLAGLGQSYAAAGNTLSNVVVDQQNPARIVVRATVKEVAQIREGGVDTPTESTGNRRFEFTVAGGAVKLVSEADDDSAATTLSASAAASAQVEVTGADQSPAPAGGDVPLGTDGFPVPEPATGPAGATTASYAGVYGNGTADWARRNIRVRREYSQDCTNFVSKALYFGGGMSTRPGNRARDYAWWDQGYFLWKPFKSYTWSAAHNLYNHLTGYRWTASIMGVHSAKPGDLVFFKWVGESRINHAAVVVSYGRTMELRQHGLVDQTTLYDALARQRRAGTPIERFWIVRPLGSS